MLICYNVSKQPKSLNPTVQHKVAGFENPCNIQLVAPDKGHACYRHIKFNVCKATKKLMFRKLMADKRKDTFRKTTVKCKLPLSAQRIQKTGCLPTHEGK